MMSPAYDRANSISFTYRAIRPLSIPPVVQASTKRMLMPPVLRPADPGRSADYVQIVFSDPTTAALEHAIQRLVRHAPRIGRGVISRFVEAQRFVLSDIQLGKSPPLSKYLVTYKIVSDDIAARFADYRRLAPSMSTSPAMGMSFGYTYKAIATDD